MHIISLSFGFIELTFRPIFSPWPEFVELVREFVGGKGESYCFRLGSSFRNSFGWYWSGKLLKEWAMTPSAHEPAHLLSFVLSFNNSKWWIRNQWAQDEITGLDCWRNTLKIKIPEKSRSYANTVTGNFLPYQRGNAH